MNEFFQELKNEARNTKLSQDEKQKMRVSLYNAIKKTPAAAVQEVRVTRAVRSTYVWFSPAFAMPLAALLVIVLGTGTAYASQDSLPGDALYTIKVYITEPAIGALAISDEAKAQWHAGVAQTRLEEAETLAASGKLDATTSAQLAANFDEHSNEVQVLAQKVENEDPGSGADIAAQFDSSLAAHDAILARVSQNASASKQFADDVALHVRDHGSVTLALAAADSDDASVEGQGQPMAMKAMSVQTFSATAPAPEEASTSETAPMSAKVQVAATSTQTPAQIKALAKLKKSAASALADAKDAFGDVKKSLDASTTLKIQGQLERISVAVNAATSTASLTGALKDATVLQAFLKASKNLKINLFTKNQSWNAPENKNAKGSNQAASSTPSTSADVKGDASAQIENSGGKGSDGGDSNGKGESDQSGGGDDDSFVRNLLKGI